MKGQMKESSPRRTTLGKSLLPLAVCAIGAGSATTAAAKPEAVAASGKTSLPPALASLSATKRQAFLKGLLENRYQGRESVTEIGNGLADFRYLQSYPSGTQSGCKYGATIQPMPGSVIEHVIVNCNSTQYLSGNANYHVGTWHTTSSLPWGNERSIFTTQGAGCTAGAHDYVSGAVYINQFWSDSFYATKTAC